MVRHITGKNGWYIGSGGESNKGFLEIGTIDDGDEEIRFVSRGSGDTIRRTLKLIDSGGNTRVPGNIYIDEALGGGGSAFISKIKHISVLAVLISICVTRLAVRQIS